MFLLNTPTADHFIDIVLGIRALERIDGHAKILAVMSYIWSPDAISVINHSNKSCVNFVRNTGLNRCEHEPQSRYSLAP